jgi:hypothetical protein
MARDSQRRTDIELERELVEAQAQTESEESE